MASGKSGLQQIAIFAWAPAKRRQNAACIVRSSTIANPAVVRIGRRYAMKSAILAALAAFSLTAMTASAADAGSWTTHWTGPAGGVYEGAGSCNDGVCKSSGTFTGPNGGVWRHAGNAHMVAPGQWAGEGSLTGPGGRTWQHQWTWQR
jgi:hypothetical protein